MTEGQTRQVDWPANTIYAAIASSAERDLVLVSGIEPNLRWRTFADGVLDAAERLGVEMVVTLGALLADVPHTRPVPITGLASDPELVERLGLSRSSYEGPTGIVGIVHDACRRRGITSASLWAAVPHYVAAVPNPKAALALLRRLEGFTGVAIEASELEDAMTRFETQVDRAVASNPEIEELVRRLELEQDDEPEFSEGDMPLGRRDRPRLPALPAPARRAPRVARLIPASRRDRHQSAEIGRTRRRRQIAVDARELSSSGWRSRTRRSGHVDQVPAVIEDRFDALADESRRVLSVDPAFHAGRVVVVVEDPDLGEDDHVPAGRLSLSSFVGPPPACPR